PGWFWHAAHEGKAKTPAQLLELYFASVGRGACLDLGIVLDPSGRMPTGDVDVLRALSATLRSTFAQDFARGAIVRATNVRGEDAAFSPQHVVDGHAPTYWATDDDVTTAELTLEFDAPVTFDVVRLREHVEFGQRVARFTLQVGEGGEWHTIHEGSTIGARRLVKLDAPRTVGALRVRIDEALACPTLSEVALFKMA
ncbi:MAG: discoidin domain-containing protein, partial [Planctomycetes bacterium]|nr:discoidin domain-containing protein [Planctomycetota bacterium]